MEGIAKVYTFALAFRKYAGWQTRKEFFEEIYINREVVQEASRTHYIIYGVCGLGRKTNRSILPASERRAKLAWAMPNQAGNVSDETILKSEVQTSDSMKKDERPGQSKLAFRGFGLGR